MRRRPTLEGLPLAGAAAVVAVVCCGGLPAIGAVLGGLTAAVVLGVAGGVVLALGAVAGVVLALRARRRKTCEPAKSRRLR